MNIWAVIDKHHNGMKRIYDNDKVAVKYALAVFGHMGPLFTFSCGPMISKDTKNLPPGRCYYNFSMVGQSKLGSEKTHGDAYIDKELVLL